MARRRPGLTYEDALRVLGKRDGTLVKVLDRLTGAVGVGAQALGVADLFDIGDQVVGWARELTRFLDEKAVGAGRYDRTQLIEAAHAVLVVASFHTALEEEAGDRATALWVLRSGGDAPDAVRQAWQHGHSRLVDAMLRSPLPIPSPNIPYEQVLDDLHAFYAAESLRWHALVPDTPSRAEGTFGLVHRAVAHYQDDFRRLAEEVPELWLWASLNDSAATRAAIDDVRTGLAGLAELLERMPLRGLDPVGQRREELARQHRARLDLPVFEHAHAAEGLALPSLGDAYVDPPCEVHRRATGQGDTESAADVVTYLAAHLTSGDAVEAPLVVFGQPGSGKSSLARILAARLPETDFMTLVIRLRDVPADATVPDQVDKGLLQVLNDRVSWAQLTGDLGGALPVIVLDGLDEMLQAVDERASYLEEVRRFQQDEAGRGFPVAVIVTSRPAVADRVRPVDGAAELRLLPFDADLIGRWVERWNELTEPSRRLPARRPLPVERVQAYAEIAGEPLLLLLIALFDWRTEGGLDELEATTAAALYEAVLKDYVLREVRRTSRGPTPREERHAVELDLRRLGVAALALLNRGALSITGDELQRDLDALAKVVGETTKAYDIVSGFYFVDRQEGVAGVGTERRTFEFLHSTVGEYLAARLIVRALEDVAGQHDGSLMAREPDAGLLWVATSFQLLSDVPRVAGFCKELLQALPAERQEDLRPTLQGLLAGSLHEHPGWSFADYRPVDSVTVHRQAAFSANLLLLVVYLAPDGVRVDDLFGSLWTFRSYAHLWRSQFPSVDSLLDHVRVVHEVEWHPRDEVEIATVEAWMRPEEGQPVRVDECLRSAHERVVGDAPVIADVRVGSRSPLGELLRTVAFFGVHDRLEPGAEALVPLLLRIPRAEGLILDGGYVRYLARWAVEVMLGPRGMARSDELFDLYGLQDFGDDPWVMPAMLRSLAFDAGVLGLDRTAELLGRGWPDAELLGELADQMEESVRVVRSISKT